MKSIIHCPVCGRVLKFEKICPDCGYEPSKDYEMYPTLNPIPSNTASAKAKRVAYAKKFEQIHTADEKAGRSRVKPVVIAIPLIIACIVFLFGLTIGKTSRQKQQMDAQEHNTDIESLKIGDTFKFGSYEQDNDTTNGKEEIDWIILDKNETSLLLISKYALDCQPYNTECTDVTWETCTLREWLNSTFLSTAFTDQDREMIPDVTVSADSNPDYNTDQGNSLTEQVFLLSVQEANQYFGKNKERRCSPTTYAIEQGAFQSIGIKVDGRSTCTWWLRSDSSSASDASYVDIDGYVDIEGCSVDNEGIIVRPALWVKLDKDVSKTKEENQDTESKEVVDSKDTEEKSDITESFEVGDTFAFGVYEQDNNTLNGKEEIEWIVLDKDKNSLLLISKYALDCQPYNTTYTDVTWETCSLRKWLNSTFLNAAFTDKECGMIPKVTVNADDNPEHSTSQGNNTTDQIFLLSVCEVREYFTGDEGAKCEPTEYAIEQGISSAYYDDLPICMWWLRSVGESAFDASDVFSDGELFSAGHDFTIDTIGVRPALWVNLESGS